VIWNDGQESGGGVNGMMKSRRSKQKVSCSTLLTICGGDDKTMTKRSAFCLMTRNTKPATALEAMMMKGEGDCRLSRSVSFQNDKD